MKDDISKLLLNKITQHLPQYLFWKDTNSIYLGCNDNYAFLHGFTSTEQIIGKSDHDLNWQSKGYTADTFRKDDKKVIDGEVILNKEEPLCLPNGKTIITLVSKRPLLNEDNVAIGIIGSFVDVTEIRCAKQRELDAKIKSHRKELLEYFSRQNSVKEALLAVAHEVNQPLSAVVSYASGCRNRLLNKYGDELPTEIQEGLNKCVEQAKHAGKIIHTLKDMFCYRKINLELVSINSLINNTVNLLAETIQEVNAELKLNLSNNIQKTECDPRQIELVLTNLIKNACEAVSEHSDKGTITLSTEQSDKNNIKIFVENTGRIIKPEILNKIFFPFVSTKNGGLGLGLSLSYNIVEQHGGKIFVDSTKKNGVKFVIILPFLTSSTNCR